MSDERKALLEQAVAEGLAPLAVVRKIKEGGLVEAGKEFNVAVELKAAYGLTTQQLHDVVGWLRGVVSDDVLESALTK